MNLIVYGHPLPSPVDLEWGTPVRTWLYQWVAWDHGLIPFVPVALLAIPGWYFLWKEHRRLGSVILGIFLIYYTLRS